MKLQYKHQRFQTDAARAVADAFIGQPKGDGTSNDLTFTIEMETGTGKTYTYIKTDDTKINIYETFKQKLDWTDDEVFKNIKVI